MLLFNSKETMTSRYISFKWYEKLLCWLGRRETYSIPTVFGAVKKKKFIFYHWLTSAGRLLSSSFSPSELKRKEPRELPNPQVGPLSTETFLTPGSGAQAGKRQHCGTHGFQVWNHRHLWIVVTSCDEVLLVTIMSQDEAEDGKIRQTQGLKQPRQGVATVKV